MNKPCKQCKSKNTYINDVDGSLLLTCPDCNYTTTYREPEQPRTWTVTAQCTVFAGDMEKKDVESSAEDILRTLTDGSDIAGISVINAERDTIE